MKYLLLFILSFPSFAEKELYRFYGNFEGINFPDKNYRLESLAGLGHIYGAGEDSTGKLFLVLNSAVKAKPPVRLADKTRFFIFSRITGWKYHPLAPPKSDASFAVFKKTAKKIRIAEKLANNIPLFFAISTKVKFPQKNKKIVTRSCYVLGIHLITLKKEKMLLSCHDIRTGEVVRMTNFKIDKLAGLLLPDIKTANAHKITH